MSTTTTTAAPTAGLELSDNGEFARTADGWRPICGDCGRLMARRSTPWSNFECCGTLHLIWAEDFPETCGDCFEHWDDCGCGA